MGNEERGIEWRPDADEIQNSYDWDSIRPSMAVVETVSATIGETPTNLETLNGVIEADALDSLFLDSDCPEEVRVKFVYNETSVVVHGTGTVVVRID